MRKIHIFIILIVIFAALRPLPCRAETAEDCYDIFEMQKLEKYGDIRGIFKKAAGGDISGALKMLDPRKMFVNGLKNCTGTMRQLLIICMLGGMIRAFAPTDGNFETLITRLLAAGLCLKVLQGLMTVLSGFAELYTAFAAAAVPIIAAVLAVSGNAVLSGAAGMMYAACTAAATAVKLIIIPCTAFYAVCGIVNALAPQAMLTRLSKLICGTVGTGLRAAGMVLCAVLALQKTAAAGADGLVRKAAVSAVKAVPLVGDIFAAGADGVMSMLTGVKNGFGAAVIILMLINAAAPLTELLASAFILRFTAAVSEPLGDKRISELIDTAGSAAMLMFTAGLCLALMFSGGAAILLTSGIN
ncbi:MAG: hypothetical protein IJR45_05840 [Firmicutes bacterium]|nr:hypothetical protein [Bacillota bacterium]